MFILSNKNEHIIKISDIHFEINFENLTCNSKTLFTDIYNNIIDSIIQIIINLELYYVKIFIVLIMIYMIIFIVICKNIYK